MWDQCVPRITMINTTTKSPSLPSPVRSGWQPNLSTVNIGLNNLKAGIFFIPLENCHQFCRGVKKPLIQGRNCQQVYREVKDGCLQKFLGKEAPAARIQDFSYTARLAMGRGKFWGRAYLSTPTVISHRNNSLQKEISRHAFLSCEVFEL